MQGRGSFPHELQTKQLEGKEAGVKAQQTEPCPRAEKGEGERQTQAWERGKCWSSQLPAAGVGSGLAALGPPQSLRILPCPQGPPASSRAPPLEKATKTSEIPEQNLPNFSHSLSGVLSVSLFAYTLCYFLIFLLNSTSVLFYLNAFIFKCI